jgi:hypothetical protein
VRTSRRRFRVANPRSGTAREAGRVPRPSMSGAGLPRRCGGVASRRTPRAHARSLSADRRCRRSHVVVGTF